MNELLLGPTSGTTQDSERWKMKITYRESKEEDNYELIEIHREILEKILSIPIPHGKYFLLIEIFFIHEELHDYWKSQDQHKGKKANTEVPSQPEEVYSSFKERREEAIYIPTLRMVHNTEEDINIDSKQNEDWEI